VAGTGFQQVMDMEHPIGLFPLSSTTNCKMLWFSIIRIASRAKLPKRIVFGDRLMISLPAVFAAIQVVVPTTGANRRL
jgi:hypothetical protein